LRIPNVSSVNRQYERLRTLILHQTDTPQGPQATEVLYIAKPRVIGWAYIGPKIPQMLVGGILFLFLSSISYGLFGLTHSILELLTMLPGVCIGFLAVIQPWLTMMNLSSLRYHFYADRMEYEDGFLKKERKTVFFRDVVDIDLHKNLFQQANDIGTLRITTRGGSAPSIWFGPFMLGRGHYRRDVNASPPLHGAILTDIPQPEATLRYVRELVDQAQKGALR
jgi:membrane protein YdbS with pleckstrin-like domain